MLQKGRLLRLRLENLVDETCESRADERSNDKEPEVAPCAPTISVGEESLAERARRIDARVGERDGDEVDERERETDGETSELTCPTSLVGRTEDDDEENESEESLGKEGADDTNCLISSTCRSHKIGTVAVGSEDTGIPSLDGRADGEEERSRKGSPDELSHPIGEHLTGGHATIDEYAKRDSRIKVRARDMANAIGHRNNGETERESDAKETYAAKESCSATAEDEPERADELGNHLSRQSHDECD